MRKLVDIAVCTTGVALFLLASLLAVPATAAAATEPEQTFLDLYFSADELQMVSATRSLKAINRIAENVHVITAEEIALLQAHSLAEVLETVTGVAIESRGGPGSLFSPYIQGSSFTQVAAFLDGVPLNNTSNDFPELTFLPVEEVARIEVIKGPASSAWGSALGGVVNVITRNPPEKDGHGGAVSGSAGKAATTDLRASLAGRAGAFGYAVTAGRLGSDGLLDGYEVERTAVTAKLAFRPDPAWSFGLALYYTGAERGEGLYPEFEEADRSEADHLRAQATAEGFLSGGSLLSLNVWGARNDDDYVAESTGDGSEYYRDHFDDRMGGAGLRYRRTLAGHDVVLGGDYEDGRLETNFLPERPTRQRWALYVNDTFDLGRVTLTAGLRRDDLETGGSFWSPSLGAVCPLGEHLLLRAYVGRGFTAPTVTAALSNLDFSYVGNPDLDVEKVLSYQGGIEGDAPGLFWYKVTLFRHDVEDGITNVDADDAGNWTYVNKDDVRRQGVELDLRSAEFHGFTLEGGAALIDAENRTSGNEAFWFADSSWRVALRYAHDGGLRALLQARRTHWETPPDFGAAGDPIVDLHLSQQIALAGLRFEVFGSGRNLLEGDQFFHSGFPNPGRWLEAGLRFRF